jgi:S-DNA-T family DNA segregation ATPase FtsK/SpoIIIE
MTTKTPTRRGANGARRVSTKTPTGFRGSLASFRDRLRHRLGRQTDDVWGVVLCVMAGLMSLSFVGQAGPVGRAIETVLNVSFGLWAFLLPVMFASFGISLIVGRPRKDHARSALGISVAFIGSQAFLHLLTGPVSLFDLMARREISAANPKTLESVLEAGGGALGALISFPLERSIGFWGAFIVLAALVITGVLVATQTTVREFFVGLRDIGTALSRWTQRTQVSIPKRPNSQRPVIVTQSPLADQGPRHKAPRKKTRPEKVRPEKKREVAPVAEVVTQAVPLDDRSYVLPPVSLLSKGSNVEHNRRSLELTAEAIEDTLAQFGVDAKLTKIVPGPTVTRYEIELEPGVKVNRVTSLSNDIAYALATPDLRLLAPIPGKSAIGIEVPNVKRQLVNLGDVLDSDVAANDTHPLSVGLGIDISGTPMMLNLSQLPHVLIAGATGAGKSSCINSLVTSILMRTHPDDVKMIMVDPKRVELGQYNGVPHLLMRVITNPRKATDALKWAVGEMDRRYDQLAEAGVRDIDGYRTKLEAGELDEESFDRFPYLVILIDELNDLMMVAGREVEDAIVRIAQMARAVGIHLVLATQRPSVNVITGVIKANIPSRLAFSVSSATDSRVILDSIGAEKLIGMGDMLVVTARDPRPNRIQGAWVEESEIESVVDWVTEQKKVQYQDTVVEASTQAQAARAAEEDDADFEIIKQAIELVVASGLGSTSMLQRKLRIGFARAGRVMDSLESRGVVGPSQGSKAREVLWSQEDLEALPS